MIISADEFRMYCGASTSGYADELIEAKLKALESLVRKYTNNNFQKRAYRCTADIIGGTFDADSAVLFEPGDTIQVAESDLNEGLYTVKEVTGSIFTVNEKTVSEKNVLVIKVEYPEDVKLGVANMVKWDLINRDKVGIQSETISRHSVTYFNMDGDNSIMGYPKSLLGFLKPYKKARF